MLWKQLRMFYCMPLMGSSQKVHRLNRQKDLCCCRALFSSGFPLPVLHLCAVLMLQSSTFACTDTFNLSRLPFFSLFSPIYTWPSTGFVSPLNPHPEVQGTTTDSRSLIQDHFFSAGRISYYSTSGHDQPDTILLLKGFLDPAPLPLLPEMQTWPNSSTCVTTRT